MDYSYSYKELIIIVDDGLLSLAYAKKCLNDLYEIITASSGESLFKLLSTVTPNLILLDIEMPEEDGYSVMRKLKVHEHTRDIPVIFLTAKNTPEDVSKGLDHGAVDYVTKPYTKSLLRQRIKVHLELQSQKKALLEAVRIADSANEAKTSFLTNMSHEMRTPLNAILGLAELTLDEKDLSEKSKSNLYKIERAGLTLLNIVSDILDISKIENGMFELSPGNYDVPARLNDTINQSVMYKGDKDIDFELTMSDNFPATLYGDDLRTKQIFNNLLSNAFKYTTSGVIGLDLKCERKDDKAYITATISDTGAGIRPEDFPHIFEDYYQIDSLANRTVAGTGLGLSIARKLARMMGGDISVESEIGKGSRFTVTLIQEYVSDLVLDSQTIAGLKTSAYISESRRNRGTLSLLSLPYAHILVVDDVETNLDVARGMLLRYGIKTTCVFDGLSAIKAMQESVEAGEEYYNAIFMDHMMPGMDGIEATRLIREIDSDYARNIPIIAFTANAVVGNQEMFLESGFQGFVFKPIELTQLDYAIVRWVYDEQLDQLCKRCKDGNVNEPLCDRECLHYGESSAPVDENAPPFVSAFSSFNIKDIDFRRGIDRFGGDEEPYLRVLRTFSKNAPSVLEAAKAFDAQNPNSYIIAVHGFKGACYGICADEVGDLAKMLEFAAKEEKYDLITANNPPFIERISLLFEEISDFLSSLEDGSAKETKDTPDKALLAGVFDACERRNMFDIDESISKLEMFEYKADGELVLWLREMADEMNYSDIIKRLEPIAK